MIPPSASRQKPGSLLMLVLYVCSSWPAASQTAELLDLVGPAPVSSRELAWPAVTRENKPWTRWWWLGSAVDTTNLTQLLTAYAKAGLGGVEICPIYGAKGYEDRFLEFLSPEWMEMLAHTTQEAKRLDLGVDLTTGTGWPFGGPRVTTEEASARVRLQDYEVAAGKVFQGTLPKGRLQCLVAFDEHGTQRDLMDQVKNGRLEWIAPAGAGIWKIYAMTLDGPVQQVKRAAPGGEGNVLDPFSVAALDRYLADFDRAFVGYGGEMPRAFFHDSYEYYNAEGTPTFLEVFAKRRGYDLRSQLPALMGQGPEDLVARVKGDYRETLGDLHLDYVRWWTEWSHDHGSLSRNQAHGGPGNLLDTYAAADIPEMEIYRTYEDRQIPMMKIAPSAAHVSGRRLASAESFTWLTEHFQASLARVKNAADYLFLSGVNHIFFHGIPYSPAEALWPGWQFYAAVNFGPQGGLWRDLPEFNGYVARCQSILQAGQPSPDVLLYLPFHDKWQTATGRLLMTFATEGTWMESEPFHGTAMHLWKRGYEFDEGSDRVLELAQGEGGKVTLGGNAYAVVLLPPCRVLPVPTARRLVALAEAGATILVQGAWPNDVPGLADWEARRRELADLWKALPFEEGSPLKSGIRRAKVGRGRILQGDDLEALLAAARVRREPMRDQEIRFVRRRHAEGYHYFLVNGGERPFDGWVSLGTLVRSAVLLDPMNAARSGLASLRTTDQGEVQVRMQLASSASCVLRTFVQKVVTGPSWKYEGTPLGEPRALTGDWKVEFVEGGPVLPASFITRELGSWTEQGDAEVPRFAGTALYTLEFEHAKEETVGDWALDLGRVAETARVTLNGQDLGTLWCPPFRRSVGRWLKAGKNTLRVEVTNLAANRIRDLDRRGEKWKYFYNANLASLTQRSGLDASDWPLFDSGLLGPVTLTPVTH